MKLEHYKNLTEQERLTFESQERSSIDQADFEVMKKVFLEEQEQAIKDGFNVDQDASRVDLIIESVGLKNKQDVLDLEQETSIFEKINEINIEANALPGEQSSNVFEINEAEMNREEFLLRKKMYEADTMAARAAQYRGEVEIPEPVGQRILAAETLEDRVWREKASSAVMLINDWNEELHKKGLNLEQFEELKYSSNEEKRLLHDILAENWVTQGIEELFDDLKEERPNLLLDSLVGIKDKLIKNGILESLLEDPRISCSKALEAGKNFLPKIGNIINKKILQSKMDSIEVFPVEEVMSIWQKDPELFHFGDSNYKNNALYTKAIACLDGHIQRVDRDAISTYLDSLEAVETLVNRDLGYEMIPSLLEQNNFGSSDKKKILRGEMPQWIFNQYKNYITESPLLPLVPENCFILEDLTNSIARKQVTALQLDTYLQKIGMTFASLNASLKYDLAILRDPEIANYFQVSDIQEVLEFKYVDPKYFPIEKAKQLKPLFIWSIMKFETSGTPLDIGDIKSLEQSIGVTPVDFDEGFKSRIITRSSSDVDTYKFFSSDDISLAIANPRYYINPLDVPTEIIEQYRNDFVEREKESFLGQDKVVAYYFLKRKDFRSAVFESMKEELDAKSVGNEKISRVKNIEASFNIGDAREKIPEEIRIVLERFEESYGPKGKNLVSLAVAAYGIESPKILTKRLESMEKILNKYDHDAIPDGARVSMGIEYEVTSSIVNRYDESSSFGYKKDIELVSRSADIAQGRDAVHEIALRPNYNPYMMLAEVKLLQDAGFIDFNFETYNQAPRGYHLSLVGDGGLSVDENINFLNNMLTMTQLSGVTAGNTISSTKKIHQKSFESLGIVSQKGVRCEMKGMATDSVEQFEKAVITSHHAGIAIQVYNKYSQDGVLNGPFVSNQEREIVFTWATLRQEITDAVSEHNESFVDSEFNGFLLDNKGEYHDTGEHIDIMRNKSLVSAETLSSEAFRNKISLSTKDLFESQTPEFVNALTNTANIFLKPPQGGENSSVNARAVIDTVKQSGYKGIVEGRSQDSLFEKDGKIREGYYTIQGASEEMIIHKSQIILNRFNAKMEALLAPGMKNEISQEESINA